MKKQEIHPHTIVINNQQKKLSKNARLNALRWLAQRFPQAFDNTLQIRPLKKGIMKDLLQYAPEAENAGISKSKLREAVVVYARRIDYLTSLKSREKRVNLLGELVEEVSEEEAEKAAVKIKRKVETCAKSAKKIVPNYIENTGKNYFSSSTEENYSKETTAKKPPIIKHKLNRNFDPEAVSRLKEKLGLAKKMKV